MKAAFLQQLLQLAVERLIVLEAIVRQRSLQSAHACESRTNFSAHRCALTRITVFTTLCHSSFLPSPL